MNRRAFLFGLLWAPMVLGTEDRFLLIGDSLAYLLRRPMWLEAKARGLTFHGEGRGGTTLAQWLDKGWARQAIQSFKPTVLLVQLGTNDRVPVNRQRFGERAKKLVALAHGKGVRVVWLFPPKMRLSTDWIIRGAQESGADDLFDTQKLDLALWEDGVHPTHKANAIWAKAIWEFLGAV